LSSANAGALNEKAPMAMAASGLMFMCVSLGQCSFQFAFSMPDTISEHSYVACAD
jgi:hypothetical protein